MMNRLFSILKFWKAGQKLNRLTVTSWRCIKGNRESCRFGRCTQPQTKDCATGRSFELAWFRWDIVGTSFRLGQGMVQNDYPNHHDFSWHHHKRSFCHRWFSIIACRCFSDCWIIIVKGWLVEGMTLSFIFKIKVLNPTGKVFPSNRTKSKLLNDYPKGMLFPLPTGASPTNYCKFLYTG